LRFHIIFVNRAGLRKHLYDSLIAFLCRECSSGGRNKDEESAMSGSSGIVCPRLIVVIVGFAACLPVPAGASPPKAAACQRVVLSGEVQSGQEWRAAFGQGWDFRVVPVQPSKEGYSGWDLVVDREEGAGYPDALLLATPPYYSISEREVGTTFGVRAQDAIGWNPRSFHFLTVPAALREGQKFFRSLGSPKIWTEKPEPSSQQQNAVQALQKINQTSSPGEFHILDAGIVPGTADPAPFAQRWALQSSRTPHTNLPSSTAQTPVIGQLVWMRFSVALWLPEGWKTPKGIRAAPGACSR
jgi:hypothetical protein